jgi:hypothetical protein
MYADRARMNSDQVEESTDALIQFLDQFKWLFSHLLQQNSTALNMLTMLINKFK